MEMRDRFTEMREMDLQVESKVMVYNRVFFEFILYMLTLVQNAHSVHFITTS